VANTSTYYCLIEQESRGIQPGVYRMTLDRGQRLVRGYSELSNKIWRQGPRGGVKIIKDRIGFGLYGYVTSNTEEMREFAWIKLQAKQIS
jgi:hypothetical protein